MGRVARPHRVDGSGAPSFRSLIAEGWGSKLLESQIGPEKRPLRPLFVDGSLLLRDHSVYTDFTVPIPKRPDSFRWPKIQKLLNMGTEELTDREWHQGLFWYANYAAICRRSESDPGLTLVAT